MRSFNLVVIGILLAVGSLFASEVKLKDGVVYNGKILARDDKIVRLGLPQGEVNLPLASIESIDGVELSTPIPSARSGLASIGEESPTLKPLSPPTPQTYIHRWRMDIFLIVFCLVTLGWIETLVWVQHDVKGMPETIRRVNALVLLLPVVGFLIYLAKRRRRRHSDDEAPRTLADRVAGVRVTEAPKQRGLFSGLSSGGTRKERIGITFLDTDGNSLSPGKFLIYLITVRFRRRGKTTGSPVVPVAAMKEAKGPKKGGLFGGRTKVVKARADKKQFEAMEFLDVDGNSIEIRRDMPEMTGIEAAREVLEDAMSERASDIHIEPQANGCRVRFRIDGALQERLTFTRADGLRVVAAIKTLAQIDVAEKRKAQDGRFRVRIGTREVDFRAATANAIHGEKVVLRILDRQSGVMSLTDLGMRKDMLEKFDRVIHSRNGIILVTGPTGSGKTSTLYAALSRLDRKRLNIMSIEDPVEYELEGATQIPVNVKAGVTYEAGLRSILRQDPDVIFVGEMRDAEAAKITVRAALTGHLVFSSIHAKNAVGTVARLEEMGVERYQICSALLMVVAQRLVRVLCEECSEPYKATGHELDEIGLDFEPGSRIYRAVGCDSCDNTGYQGRTGIFEMLVMDEELRRVLNEGANEQVLAKLAAGKGLRSYYCDGAEKILLGVTSVEEVLQAS